MCLRAATRQVESARWCDIDAAIQLAEQQIARPFQLLIWASERHLEESGEVILGDDEEEAMGYFIKDVEKFRRERRYPFFVEADCENIVRLKTKYANAIAEKRGICSDPESEPDDHNFWHVRLAMVAANTEPARGGE